MHQVTVPSVSRCALLLLVRQSFSSSENSQVPPKTSGVSSPSNLPALPSNPRLRRSSLPPTSRAARRWPCTATIKRRTRCPKSTTTPTTTTPDTPQTRFLERLRRRGQHRKLPPRAACHSKAAVPTYTRATFRSACEFAAQIPAPPVVGALRTLVNSSFDLYIYMNTASKLGPHTQTDRGTCPGVGL
jgi:hypothetical protein